MNYCTCSSKMDYQVHQIARCTASTPESLNSSNHHDDGGRAFPVSWQQSTCCSFHCLPVSPLLFSAAFRPVPLLFSAAFPAGLCHSGVCSPNSCAGSSWNSGITHQQQRWSVHHLARLYYNVVYVHKVKTKFVGTGRTATLRTKSPLSARESASAIMSLSWSGPRLHPAGATGIQFIQLQCSWPGQRRASSSGDLNGQGPLWLAVACLSRSPARIYEHTAFVRWCSWKI